MLDGLHDNLPTSKYARTKGYLPSKEENKYNAWSVKLEIKGESSGKLLGKRVVIKDSVSVEGVRMMNGANYLEDFTSDLDANVVRRILEQGKPNSFFFYIKFFLKKFIFF